MDVDFEKVPELTSGQVHDFVKGAFLANRTAEAIYMLGPARRASDIIESWRATSACRWCTRCPRNAGTSRGTSRSASR